MKKLIAAQIVLGLTLVPQVVDAQDDGGSELLTSLDSLLNMSVSAASLYEQSRSEAPGQVTVITAEEIEGFGYRNLAEVLQSVAGFNMSSDLQYTYTGVRGFGRPADLNHRVLVLVDGHTLNESVLGAIPVGNAFPIDIEAMERVEVIRGPGSPLYGTRAMLAVINVITKKGRDLSQVHGAVESGSNGSYGATLRAGNESSRGLEYALFGSWNESDGQDFYFPEFDSPATPGGLSSGMAWESYARGSGTLSFGGASLAVGLSQREKGVPTAPYGTTFNDPSAHTADRQEFYELRYRRVLGQGVELFGRANHDHYRNAGQYPYPTGLLQATFESRATAGEAHLQWDLASNHRLVLGGEVQRVHAANFDQAFVGAFTIFETDYPYWVYSVFAQDEVQLTRQLALTLGARHDRYREEARSTTNPRVALVYHPAESTTIKGVFGTAFRTANVYERLLDSPGSHLPNLDLVPETIRTMEVALEQRLGRSVAVQLGAYQNRMDQLIEQVPVSMAPSGLPITQFQNRSSVTAYGIETELSGSFREGLRGFVRYSFQRASDGDTNQRISNFPGHSVKVGALTDVRARFGVGVDAIFESGRMTLRGGEVDPFVVVNATVRTRPIMRRLTLAGSLKNVFDARYALPGGFHHAQEGLVQEARRFYLELRVTP